jgi:hypothetical protein
MSAQEKLVAIISPWEKLSNLVKNQFWVESLPAEKKVMVWREDLQTTPALTAELKSAGITAIEVRTNAVTTNWKRVE